MQLLPAKNKKNGKCEECVMSWRQPLEAVKNPEQSLTGQLSASRVQNITISLTSSAAGVNRSAETAHRQFNHAKSTSSYFKPPHLTSENSYNSIISKEHEQKANPCGKPQHRLRVREIPSSTILKPQRRPSPPTIEIPVPSTSPFAVEAPSPSPSSSSSISPPPPGRRSYAVTLKCRRQEIPLIFLLGCLLLLPTVLQAACRDERSRQCEVICQEMPDGRGGVWRRNCTIRALVLLPFSDFYEASWQKVEPILKVAEERLRKTRLIPSYIRFQWLPKDDKCDASFAMIEAMDGIVKKCAHVIFGPVCDYPLAAVSRITKYFNSQGTPLISVGGSTYDFEMKKTSCSDEFYMLVRTGILSFETISDLTISIMKRNRWSHSIFFYERDGQSNVAGQHTCFLMMKSLGMQMRKENMTFAQYPIKTNLTNRSEELKSEIGNKHAIVERFMNFYHAMNPDYQCEGDPIKQIDREPGEITEQDACPWTIEEYCPEAFTNMVYRCCGLANRSFGIFIDVFVETASGFTFWVLFPLAAILATVTYIKEKKPKAKANQNNPQN